MKIDKMKIIYQQGNIGTQIQKSGMNFSHYKGPKIDLLLCGMCKDYSNYQ